MLILTKPYTRVFRDDVVDAVRSREPRAPPQSDRGRLRHQRVMPDQLAQGRRVEDGVQPGTAEAETTELCDARRRTRLLAQGNGVLRRAAAYLSGEPCGR